jgi:hypothetical protein
MSSSGSLHSSGLLLASLQRVYLSAGKSPPPSSIEAGAHSIEGVWDVNDLDPLPFVSPRNELAGTNHLSRTQAAASGAEPTSTGNEPAGLDRAATPDRRKLPRRDSDCAILICTYNGSDRPTPERIAWMLHAAKSRGHLIDVSMSGVALAVTEPFDPGTRVVLRISNRALSKHVDASANVLRCREDGGEWNVVCRFDKNLTFEQIHLIGRNLFASTIV